MCAAENLTEKPTKKLKRLMGKVSKNSDQEVDGEVNDLLEEFISAKLRILLRRSSARKSDNPLDSKTRKDLDNLFKNINSDDPFKEFSADLPHLRVYFSCDNLSKGYAWRTWEWSWEFDCSDGYEALGVGELKFRSLI